MIIILFIFFWIFNQSAFASIPDPSNTPIPDPSNTPIPDPGNTPIPDPSNTPIPDPSNTPIPDPSNTPTLDPTIINPSSGISLTEFMPYSSTEWIEIYNDNDKQVELKNWTIKNSDSKTKPILSLKILPKSYAIYELDYMLSNNEGDSIILINHNNEVVNQYEYPSGKLTLERSWSLVNNSWCQAEITKNSPNTLSCYQAPLPTVILAITNTPTPTKLLSPTNMNLYKNDESTVPLTVFTPTEEVSLHISSTTPTTLISSNPVLGDTTTAKKNYLPLIFIVSGGLLLLSPLIFDKLNKK